jgi:arsenite methyltransferase
MNLKANMFNAGARKNADAVLNALGVSRRNIIADIGPGGGFYACEFANITGPSGAVYAADVNEKFLAYIEKRREKTGLRNITTVKADESSPNLPDRCDLVFMRDVFHHITDPAAYFLRLRESLKPEGRVAIIDWKPGASHRGHGTSQEDIERIMKSAGYELFESYDILEKQVFCIFKIANEGKQRSEKDKRDAPARGARNTLQAV